ncbi:MAG: sugar phosphate isomerase/epimerase [Clostridia bacterium]|jgi:sugar phosphate isomerase/epimerase|nr:sugar phosphate isomerase/epimerase [Clostridia bacterium]
MRPVTLFTGQWADLPFDEMCKTASEMGYEGLELATWGNHVDATKAANDMEYVASLKADLDKYGLKTWAISAHLCGQLVCDVYDERHAGFAPAEFANDEAKMRQWAIDYTMDTIKAASNLGIKVITGFMGSPIWNAWYSFPQTSQEMIDKGFADVVAAWTPLFDEMDKHGIKFALEVHPTEIAFDYYSFVKLLEAFEYRETLGMNFDPSHLLWQGLIPHLMIRALPDRVYHVHIKDAAVTLDGLNGILGSHIEFGDTRRGWNFRSPGRGHVDFNEIVRELNQIGYDGPLSVEWEDSGMDRILGGTEACEFTKDVNISPYAGAFDDALKTD